MNRYIRLLWIASTAAMVSACDTPTFAEEAGKQGVGRKPDVVFVPTPESVVRQMLKMADVGPNDVVYDLGCGDGRIPIAAVKEFGAKSAVCVDIDPQRIKEIKANVEAAGVADKVEVRHADLFQVDVSPATVVTLYLLPELNVRLRPKLMRELPEGARIVSQSFDMAEWTPEAKAEVDGKPIYLWTVRKEGKQTKPTNPTKPTK